MKVILFKHLPLSEIINHFNFNTEPSYDNQHNFIPFKTIGYYLFLAEVNFNIRLNNLVGNVVSFIPFGFLFPFLFKKLLSFKKIIAYTLCLSIGFEIFQLTFSFGSFDVDDLILNTVGGALGYLSVKLYKMYDKRPDAQRSIEQLNSN